MSATEINFRFGEQLRKHLHISGENASQLARAVGLSHVTICNYLKGRMPRSLHLSAISEHFKVPMEELLGRDERERSAPVKCHSFSKALAIWMERREVNQPTLARTSGIGQSTISNYLRGARRPGADELAALSRALNVPMEELLCGHSYHSAGRATSRPVLDALLALTQKTKDSE